MSSSTLIRVILVLLAAATVAFLVSASLQTASAQFDVLQYYQGGTSTGTSAAWGHVFYWNGTGWQGIATSSLGIVSGANQTPWTSDIDADGFDLFDLGGLTATSGQWLLGTTSPAFSLPFAVQGGGFFAGDLYSADMTATDTLRVGTAAVFGDSFFWSNADDAVSLGAEEYAMTVDGVSVPSRLSVHSEGAGTQAEIESHRHSDTATFASIVYGARSRGTEGSETAVVSGDDLFNLVAVGHDGTDYETSGSLEFEVDDTVSNNVVPGRFRVLTVNTSGLPVEALRVTSGQNVGISTTSPSQDLSVHGNQLISGNLGVANITATGTVTINSSQERPLVITGVGSGHGTRATIDCDPTVEDAFCAFEIASGTPPGANFIAAFTVNKDDTTEVQLWGNNPAQPYISLNDGNVGVSTSSPSQPLSVHGGALIAGTTTVHALYATSSVTTAGALYFQSGESAGKIVFTPNDNDTITIPDLDVSGLPQRFALSDNTFSSGELAIVGSFGQLSGLTMGSAAELVGVNSVAGGYSHYTIQGTANEVEVTTVSDTSMTFGIPDNVILVNATSTAATTTSLYVSGATILNGASSTITGTAQLEGGYIAGSGVNVGSISSEGKLTFSGGGSYQVPLSRYAFNTASFPLAGVYFDAVNFQVQVVSTSGATTTAFSVLPGSANSFVNQVNFGVGTTSPASAKLAVHGNVLVSGNINSVANITATGTTRLALGLFASSSVAFSGLTGSITGNAVCITTTSAITDAGAAACVPSARRFKTNVIDMPYGKAISTLNKLRVVEFDYKENAHSPEDSPHSYGMIAEEVELVDENLVDYDREGNVVSLAWFKFTGLFTKAIQELADWNDEQDRQITELQLENAQLRGELEELKQLWQSQK